MYTDALKDGWMQTYAGVQFWPAKPRQQDIKIVDIARSLSNQCRYAGHCQRFYSVAEHCVLASRAAPDHLKLTALMHDASEAYLVDIPKPVKPLLKGYYEIENHLMQQIADRYLFQWPLPQEVKDIDMALLRDEREQNMKPMDPVCPPELWGDLVPGTGQRLLFWEPEQAYNIFLGAFYKARELAHAAA